MTDSACIECGSHEHPTRDCPHWNVDYAAKEKTVPSPETINVYVVLNSEKMIETFWSNEWGSDDYEPRDAVEQVSQKVRAGEPIYGRLIDSESGPSETFRWFAVEPRSIEMVFANA